jgi:hypothetical protein
MLRVINPHLGKSSLPDGCSEAKLFPRAERKAAFDELDCALNSHLAFDGYHDVKVVGHDDEIVQEIFVLIAVVMEDLDE